MKKDDFIQASTRTRVLEKKLLTNAQIERMVESADIKELFRILSETGYQDYFAKIKDERDYESALTQILIDTYHDATWISPNKELIRFIQLRYDYHNYKVFMKELLLKEPQDALYLPYGSKNFIEEKETLLQLDEEVRAKEFPKFYQEVLLEYEKNQDVQMIDIIIDKAFYEEMKGLSDSLDNQMIDRYVKEEIDFTNIKTLLRMKKQLKNVAKLQDVLVPGGTIPLEEFTNLFFESIEDIVHKLKSYSLGSTLLQGLKEMEQGGGIGALEKAFENHEMELLQETKKISYGPEVLFSYVLAKENEVKNLRMILVSKLNGVESEAIRKRLRRTYV